MGRRDARQAMRRRNDKAVVLVVTTAGNDEAPPFAHGDDGANRLVLRALLA
jgi:hypothetical protein